ncbi:hypothetical protein CsSME_00004553 [Camellia sinensis var. sinensis]
MAKGIFKLPNQLIGAQDFWFGLCYGVTHDSGNKGKDADLPENGRSNGVKKNCAHCHTTKTSKWRTGPEGPLSICNGCGIKFEEEKEPPSINDHNKESCLVSNIGADDEYREILIGGVIDQ